MPTCYVFDNQSDAVAAVDKIDERARIIYAAQGYTVDTDGTIIGIKASDDSLMHDAPRTETWDIPRQRQDGKWVVRTTETCPGHNYPVGKTGMNVAQFVSQDITNTQIEDEDSSWWD